MNGILPGKAHQFVLLTLGVVLAALCGCSTARTYSGITIVRKAPQNEPFIFKNNISLDAQGATSDERLALESRLKGQIHDSAKVKIKDVVFLFHYISRPPVFDTANVAKSGRNMEAALKNLGWFTPEVTYDFDTVFKKNKSQQRIITNYFVETGKRTTVDTVAYLFGTPELKRLADENYEKTLLPQGDPVTRPAVNSEANRLVDIFQNHGYYKFSADEIRVIGDTTIEALTTVADNPFEQLLLLAEAARQRENPTIRVGYQLGTSDSSRLQKYFMGDIYILPDYKPGDLYTDTTLTTTSLPAFTLKYHEKKFKTGIFKNQIVLKEGEVFNKDDYYKTINNLYQLGVWESPNIDLIERDSNLLDMVIKLLPLKRYGFEGNIEMSYSANNSTGALTTTSTGNLLGLYTNISLTDRNLFRSALRMTNSIRLGMELNTSRRNSMGSFINSNEITYSNSLLFPRLIFPFAIFDSRNWLTRQSVVNTNVSLINRIDFFNQQIINTSYGFNFSRRKNQLWSLKLLNFDYRRIYNRSARFDQTLEENPFLRYSFNTALVMGTSLGYSLAYSPPRNPGVVNTVKMNLEESGLLWGVLKQGNRQAHTGNFFNKYLREFLKADVEFTHTIRHPKSAIAFRTFAGVGIPLSKADTTLPFFKQYFGGGPNSMRGWPVRGIGVGGQKLAPYKVAGARFNDRTGDIQLEGNVEYRFDVAPLFNNALLFKMALFADAGNIWNFKNTRPDGLPDTTQFQFKNLYKQLGVSSGVGFRFDFSYFLLRLDVAFRFKRPDVLENSGWQIPDVNFQNLFGSALENRIWRYQNFNATIGIDYPF